MTLDEYLKLIPVARVRPEVEYACRFLEIRGERFGEDFTFIDSIEKATSKVLEDIEMDEAYGI